MLDEKYKSGPILQALNFCLNSSYLDLRLLHWGAFRRWHDLKLCEESVARELTTSHP